MKITARLAAIFIKRVMCPRTTLLIAFPSKHAELWSEQVGERRNTCTDSPAQNTPANTTRSDLPPGIPASWAQPVARWHSLNSTLRAGCKRNRVRCPFCHPITVCSGKMKLSFVSTGTSRSERGDNRRKLALR